MNVFTEIEIDNKTRVYNDTWGHLRQEENKVYNGHIVWTVDVFGGNNVAVIKCTFDSSPWFYHALQEFLFKQENEIGCIYEFHGSCKNEEFTGMIEKVQEYA